MYHLTSYCYMQCIIIVWSGFNTDFRFALMTELALH